MVVRARDVALLRRDADEGPILQGAGPCLPAMLKMQCGSGTASCGCSA